MAVNSVQPGITTLSFSIQNLKSQLDNLQTQLATGKQSTTYAGMGANEGFAIAARSQLSDISAFTDTMSNVGTTISVSNTALQSLLDIKNQVQTVVNGGSGTLNQLGQTVVQQVGTSELSSMIDILNTQSGDRYIFSGGAIQTPAVASMDSILNGNGAQAGLKQVIAERLQADQGTGTGRLVITAPTATSVQVAEDASPSPFGLKLASVTSTLTGATVTGPAGVPAAASVDLGATNPNNGDTITYTFNLPDGSQEQIALTASTANPPPAGSFAIGATSTATAANLQAALTTAIGNLSDGALVAASAIAASNDFFGSPPQRVGTAPFSTATTLVAGTPANTVSWYTGDAGAGPARGTAVARIDQSQTVQYGMRANEQAIRSLLQGAAVSAAVTFSPADPNAQAQITAFDLRVGQSLNPQPGQQTIQDIQSDLANAQEAMKDAGTRQSQTQVTLQSIIDQAENASPDKVASEILALQTSLQASYQTTAQLSQLSLVKFLPIPTG
jgi:flagellin-like hook-associated protein FlgL